MGLVDDHNPRAERELRRYIEGLELAVTKLASKEAAQTIATDFHFWWMAQPGSNTMQGFDDWWELPVPVPPASKNTP